MVKGTVEEACNGSKMTMLNLLAKAKSTTGDSQIHIRLTKTFISNSWVTREKSITSLTYCKKVETSKWSLLHAITKIHSSIRPMKAMTILSTISISFIGFLSRKKVSATRTNRRRLGTTLRSQDITLATKAQFLSICTSNTLQTKQCKASACNSNGTNHPILGATMMALSTIINTRIAEVNPLRSTNKLQPTGSTIQEMITINPRALVEAAGISHQDRPQAVAKVANGTSHRVVASSNPLMRCHTTTM